MPNNNPEKEESSSSHEPRSAKQSSRNTAAAEAPHPSYPAENQLQPPPMPPLPHPHTSLYHPYLPPPPPGYTGGPYSAAVNQAGPPGAGPPAYHPHHAPSAPRQHQQPQQQGHGSSQGSQAPPNSTKAIRGQPSNSASSAGHSHSTSMPSVPPMHSLPMQSHAQPFESRETPQQHEHAQQQQQTKSHGYHRPVAVRAPTSHPSHPIDSHPDYRGHPPPPPPTIGGSYSGLPPPHPSHYGAHPADDRRWMPETGVGHPPPPPPSHQQHHFGGYDSQRGYHGKPPPMSHHSAPQSYPPHPGHHSVQHYRYPHHPYPPTAPASLAPTASRDDDKPRGTVHDHPPSKSQSTTSSDPCMKNNDPAVDVYNDMDGREGATSPSQIELSHRDEVTNMGCTCKKTKCLKLYCQCFAVKIYCGTNCRCLVCFNTTKHEKQRKEAMRSILSRNPTAFDTKFSKTKLERKTKDNTILAHKLGCKCRKSACMKKYCECYAGNVKCSPNCRCIGCKNIPPNFAPGKPGENGSVVSEGGLALPAMPSAPHGGGARTGREPWMMNAAQNLAFMKHGSSPAQSEKAVTAVQDAAEVSMPSLAAASSDTSPGDRTVETAANKAAELPKAAPNGNAVNSLLMAAMAMTEFQSQNPGALNTVETNPAKAKSADIEDDLKPAAREVFRSSPKRKQSGLDGPEGTLGDLPGKKAGTDSQARYTAVAGDEPFVEYKEQDDSASSLADPRELKRTRLGSVKKKMNWEKDDDGQSSPVGMSTKENSLAVQQTPDQKTTLDNLTPVSARCIDFRRMKVNESKDSTIEKS